LLVLAPAHVADEPRVVVNDALAPERERGVLERLVRQRQPVDGGKAGGIRHDGIRGFSVRRAVVVVDGVLDPDGFGDQRRLVQLGGLETGADAARERLRRVREFRLIHGLVAYAPIQENLSVLECSPERAGAQRRLGQRRNDDGKTESASHAKCLKKKPPSTSPSRRPVGGIATRPGIGPQRPARRWLRGRKSLYKPRANRSGRALLCAQRSVRGGFFVAR
jgi:hypothetical protein